MSVPKRKRVIVWKYRSSDRTHVTRVRWTKAECAEWRQSGEETMERFHQYLKCGDMPSALSCVISLRDFPGCNALAYDATRAFIERFRT